MKREWKPGDVAVLGMGIGGSIPVIAIRNSGGYWDDGSDTIHDSFPHWVRPVIAIDAENREQVERLAGGEGRVDVDWLQGRLRSLIAPPVEVYEHFANSLPARADGPTVAICGKVWKADAPNTKSVGRCPECVEIVAAGWTK